MKLPEHPIISLIVLFCFLIAATGLARPASAAERFRKKKPVDRDAFLHAIRDVETGDDPGAEGPGGELSAYQFTAATWRRYTSADFSCARSLPGLAERVARVHFAVLVKSLGLAGKDPRALAAAWRWGERHHPKHRLSPYAQRVAASYENYLAEAAR
jgi:hypothetical protein